ncbi:DMT family transporter [Albidovulum sediminicola]|uniref:DMT family transporter n=1 Tax=Albidovulum sediminicola TaxID=2984331 RepID=A0ABT2Z2Q8_9RHOB|nr:DMT family transporter [Defluviimonas sp. WL0075]MCV2865391.1 DMT family transporter [Defluviimonas sp. WL0075]
MTTLAGTAPANRTLAAAGAILVYALLIGFTDNFVQHIAADGGLWQFHVMRTVMAFALLGLAAVPLRLRLRPRNWRAVGFRSLVHGSAMVVYFGCLAFLPVAVVAAGLFTAPIFVLLISRLAFGIHIGPFRILAVAVGFLGVMMVLGPGGDVAIGPATVLPVAAGALYALGNIATRQWCAKESAETMVAGFFAALGCYGVLGLLVLAVWQPEVPAGTEGFILRGAVWPTASFLIWTFIQAGGSLLGVAMMVKAYQMAEASRVAVFEYVILPASALWTWIIWGELLSARAMAGMVLIFLAGLIIALRGR